MKKNNLPLLDWQPPCTILVFPLKARISRVRRTAWLLYQKHGDDAELYWKQVLAANRRHLSRIGLTSEQQNEQISDFFNAVKQELNIISISHDGVGVQHDRS